MQRIMGLLPGLVGQVADASIRILQEVHGGGSKWRRGGVRSETPMPVATPRTFALTPIRLSQYKLAFPAKPSPLQGNAPP